VISVELLTSTTLYKELQMTNIKTTIMGYTDDFAVIVESADTHTKDFLHSLEHDDPRIVGYISRKRNCRKLELKYKGQHLRVNNWWKEAVDWIESQNTNQPCYAYHIK
jgi:hypothetical protein